MRTADINTVNSLYAAPGEGQVTRDFVFITGKELDTGAPVTFGFSNMLETESLSVISPATGNPVSRVYVGEGTLKEPVTVTLRTGMMVQSLDITLSAIHPEVALMVRGKNIRFGKIEVHRGRFDTKSKRLVAPPIPHFEGEVNEVEIKRPRRGGEGAIIVKCVDFTINFTRANYRKRSHETIHARKGDMIGQYLDPMKHRSQPWGNVEQEKKSGGKVICTELNRQGLLPDDIYEADVAYAQAYGEESVLAAYHAWAVPLTRLMARSVVLTGLVAPFGRAWAYHMAYAMGVAPRDNLLGRCMHAIGVPVHRMIGRAFAKRVVHNG